MLLLLSQLVNSNYSYFSFLFFFYNSFSPLCFDVNDLLHLPIILCILLYSQDVASHDCISKNVTTHAARRRTTPAASAGGAGTSAAGAAGGAGSERRPGPPAGRGFSFGVKNLFSILY